MSKWINCNAVPTLVPFPNSFLVVFPTRKCLEVDKSTLFKLPNKASFVNQFLIFLANMTNTGQTFT